MEDDNLTPSSTPSSSQSNKSFRIKHEASPVKNLDPTDGAYTDQNESNQLINLFNRSQNTNSHNRGSTTLDKNEKPGTDKLQVPG